jgi:phosphoadenosine phosphosulfate reductase
MKISIDEKIQEAQNILKETFDRFGSDNLAIAITGGKDSTTTLWLVKQVCEKFGTPMPKCMFIDEGDVFEEIEEFVEKIRNSWALNIVTLKNKDVSSKISQIGDLINISELNEMNKKALEEMNFSEITFPFVPDSTICNHLMKTIPMRQFIIDENIKALIIAIRKDEQTARKDEQFFSHRDNPDHWRVHPILNFTERDVWVSIFKNDIPFNKLYKLGYRSLGAKCATGKNSDIPAWMQDLENTPERVGRGQEKEQVMDQLRALGYM